MQANWPFKPATVPAGFDHVRLPGSVTAVVATVLPMPNVVRPAPGITSPGNDEEDGDTSGPGEAGLDHVSHQVINRVREVDSCPVTGRGRDTAMQRLRAYRRAAGPMAADAGERQADMDIEV